MNRIIDPSKAVLEAKLSSIPYSETQHLCIYNQKPKGAFPPRPILLVLSYSFRFYSDAVQSQSKTRKTHWAIGEKNFARRHPHLS